MGGVFGERPRTRVARRRPQARACPASGTGERRRWWLPGDALVEFEGGGGLEQRISGGIVLGVGGRPQRRAAAGRELRNRALASGTVSSLDAHRAKRHGGERMATTEELGAERW